MVSDERGSNASTGTIDESHDRRVITLHAPLSRELTQADRVRGVTKSLVEDALATLRKMAKDCHGTPELLENYYELHHCLDYLKRFCDKKV